MPHPSSSRALRCALALLTAFSVVVPHPDPVALPVGVGVRRGEHDLIGFVNDWLVLQRASGELKEARDYWVLGRGAQAKRPRWSVMHDVLGWGLSLIHISPVKRSGSSSVPSIPTTSASSTWWACCCSCSPCRDVYKRQV